MMKEFNVYELEEDFSFKPDIFDESRLQTVKQIMANKLTATEKRILLIYCFSGSSRKAEALTTIKFRQVAVVVKRAVSKIRKELKKIELNNQKIIV